jgi:hypothetical protein
MFCLSYICHNKSNTVDFIQKVARSLNDGGGFCVTLLDSDSVLANAPVSNHAGSVEMVMNNLLTDWGQLVRFSLWAQQAGVRDQVEYLIPWEDFCQICDSVGLRLVNTTLFGTERGFGRLTADEQEISQLYRWAVFKKS